MEKQEYKTLSVRLPAQLVDEIRAAACILAKTRTTPDSRPYWGVVSLVEDALSREIALLRVKHNEARPFATDLKPVPGRKIA